MRARPGLWLHSARVGLLLSLAACDEHLQIGSVLDAGERESKPGASGVVRDVQFWLRSHGRDNVSRLIAPCAGECSRIEVEAEPAGTPLSVTWSDGAEGAARDLCVAGSQQLSAIVEADSMPARPQTLSLELAADHCDLPVPSGLPWQVCQRVPLREQPDACGADEVTGGIVYPSGSWDSTQPASVRLLFRVPRAVTATIEVSTAALGCHDRMPLSSPSLSFGAYDVGEVWFEIRRPQLAALLILQGSGASGTPPAGVTLEALEVCEAL